MIYYISYFVQSSNNDFKVAKITYSAFKHIYGKLCSQNLSVTSTVVENIGVGVARFATGDVRCIGKLSVCITNYS